MLQDILSAAREQAEQSDAPVKAAALLRIARVLTAFDQAEADRVLEGGIALATELPEPDRSTIINCAVSLAATVSPQRALRLASSIGGLTFGGIDGLIFAMLNHGHVAEAISYLCEPMPGEDYPFGAAGNAISLSREEEMRRKILRAAIAAWLGNSESPYAGTQFLRLFNHRWRVLPEGEATEAVRKIVQRVVSEPDQRTNARFSNGPKTAEFSSTCSSGLFRILGPLRKLDAELASSLCRRYPELAIASASYPDGYGPEMRVTPQPAADQASLDPEEEPDYIAVGKTGLVPIPEALKTNFKVAFDEAFRLYALDTTLDKRNEAPKECWPSTNEFRNILYKAGEYEGSSAVRHLDRIPDVDVRLFARIELAAAIAGLPQVGHTNIYARP
jgi:hypothetical protein